MPDTMKWVREKNYEYPGVQRDMGVHNDDWYHVVIKYGPVFRWYGLDGIYHEETQGHETVTEEVARFKHMGDAYTYAYELATQVERVWSKHPIPTRILLQS